MSFKSLNISLKTFGDILKDTEPGSCR
jgi:hypothetical protein